MVWCAAVFINILHHRPPFCGRPDNIRVHHDCSDKDLLSEFKEIIGPQFSTLCKEFWWKYRLQAQHKVLFPRQEIHDSGTAHAELLPYAGPCMQAKAHPQAKQAEQMHNIATDDRSLDPLLEALQLAKYIPVLKVSALTHTLSLLSLSLFSLSLSLPSLSQLLSVSIA